jgi:hypothetical protein
MWLRILILMHFGELGVRNARSPSELQSGDIPKYFQQTVLIKVNLSLGLIIWGACHKDIWGNGALLSPFLTSILDGGEWSDSRPGRFTPGKQPPVPIVQEAGWASEPVWTLWRREQSLSPTRIQTPTPRSSSLGTILTELSRLPDCTDRIAKWARAATFVVNIRMKLY